MPEKKLTEYLKIGRDWSRLRTSVPGVFVLKLPSYRSAPPRLAVELNPVDDDGKPKKRRGFILQSSVELEDFQAVFQYEKIAKLLTMVDAVNPTIERRRREREDVLEL